MIKIPDTLACQSVSEMQYVFDTVQGRYGREDLTMRKSGSYNYLHSLAASFEQGADTAIR